MSKTQLIFCFFVAVFFVSCYRAPRTLEPCLTEPMHPKERMHEEGVCFELPEGFSVRPFPALTEEELTQDWAKQLNLGYLFACDFDLYRALTAFKSACYLMPSEYTERRLEVQYAIALAYFLGKKYSDCLMQIENSELIKVDSTFAAFSDLLLILYDSYKHVGECEKAEHIFALIKCHDENAWQNISLLTLLEDAQVSDIEDFTCENPRFSYVEDITDGYCREAKSVGKAELLNAVLPGAGYWYVGQKQTAVTAFIVNALFIAATVEFFHHGYTAAGIITASIESGWYFGGIYGGGLAAKCYNEHLYCTYAERITAQEKLYPITLLRFTF